MLGHTCVALFARHSWSTEALAGVNVASHIEGSSAVAVTRFATITTVYKKRSITVRILALK